MPIRRIVSGGQTGADRGALDAAIESGVEIGGWVPQGRSDETGRIPECYFGLVEADSADPAMRTELNVRDSDATLILSHGPLRGGSAHTLQSAEALGRPVLHLDLARLSGDDAVVRAREWLEREQPAVLNVAGPRASADGRIYAATRDVVRRLLLAPARERAD